jgi:chemotaxis protein CheZ
LVNRIGFWIHHAEGRARFYPPAFIFGEWREPWLTAGVQARAAMRNNSSGVNPVLNRVCVKPYLSKVRDNLMPTHRRRFRIEEPFTGDMPIPAATEGEIGPLHREIMSELRAMRALMAGARRIDRLGCRAAAAVSREVAQAHALLETYRAQIEQCEKLKVELDLIHDAISRTKREIAVLHGNSFNGEEMARVNGELGAVVGGTEQATQQILEATEAIDQAASAMAKVTSPDQHKILSEEIQERVVSIFEACNFQDLTGQRINKVMTTMKFIENHITVMMDIWGGVDAIKAHAPAIVDTRADDAKLLNGPKLDGDVGHASQDDIDALFD